MLNQMNICLNNYSEQNILLVVVNLFPGEELTSLPHGSNTAQVHVNLPFFDYLSHKLSNSQFVSGALLLFRVVCSKDRV